jgi:SAM-dependent methyltransferase
MSKVQRYYDEMAEFYQKLGLTDRNYKIQELLLRFGLQKTHVVLEIGCGTGVQTQLLSKMSREVFAVDISPVSIGIAQRHFSRLKNVKWQAADVLEIDFSEKFDIIVLPDVLHYIPEDDHTRLFQKMKKWLLPNGFILIHSPSAEFVEWSRENDITNLNVDDIALDNQQIMNHCRSNNLKIKAIEQYALWHRGGDYEYWVIQHEGNNDFDMRTLPFIKKVKKVLNRMFLKTFSRNLF